MRHHQASSGIPDPDRRAQALRIHQRHARLNRCDLLIEALRPLACGDTRWAVAVASLVREAGALLERKTPEEIQARLESSLWIVCEQNRCLPDGSWVGADCHIHLPDDRPDADPVIDLPASEGDCRSAEGLQQLRSIRSCPANAACVADIVADRATQHTGLARAVKCEAVERLRALNCTRRYPVRLLVGEIFCIRGLALPDGTRLLLADHGLDPIRNVRSLRFNRHLGQRVAWVAKDQLIPGGNTSGALVLDWEIYLIELERFLGTSGGGA